MLYIKNFAKTIFTRRSVPIWTIILGCCLYMSACVKNDKLYSDAEGNIYMPQAYSEKGDLIVYQIDSPQTYYFGIAYGGFKSAPQDITANFEIDTSLIAQYNTDNAYLGKHYVALPDSTYTIPNLSSVLKAGTTSSVPAPFSVYANKLQKGTYYLLPIKLTNISSGSIDTSLTVAYFKIDSIYTRSRDVTTPGKLTVSNENSGGAGAGEGSSRLIDNDNSTKFYVGFVPNMWMQLKLDSAQSINSYTLVSGGDAQNRDPRDFELQGSNDGNTWTVLDERTGNIFAQRSTAYTFELNHPTGQAYSYYRLFVKTNNGDGGFQLSEWRLIQYY